MFVWPTFKQTVEAVCEGLDAAWRFFDGVPRALVFDNPKTIVIKAEAGQAGKQAGTVASFAIKKRG
jgi:transposase